MTNVIKSETLLLVEGNDHRNFFEAFRDRLTIPEMQIGRTILRSEKARACAYLATTRDPHVSVGVAAKKGVWNFTHDAFNKIREFLSRLDAR